MSAIFTLSILGLEFCDNEILVTKRFFIFYKLFNNI